MSEMVERVARKLCALNCCDPDDLAPDYMHNKERVQAGNPPRQWEDYVDDARAAIEEMREPSEAMTAVGGNFIDDDCETLARTIWEGMIDEALGETP